MADDGHYFRNTLTKHVNDISTHYCDFGPWLRTGVTISRIDSVTCSDTALTIDALAVLTSGATDVPDLKGDRDIAASEGVSFRLQAGTAIDDDADSAEIAVTVTLSDSQTITRLGRLRVKS
jgi:hypothetical protein